MKQHRFDIQLCILIFTFSLFFIFASCENSYANLLSELNNNFTEVGEEKTILRIGEEGFSAGMMIPYFQYTIHKNAYLCLFAPEGADTYEWIIELENEKTNKRALINRSVGQTPSLYYKPPESIKLGTVYNLTLNAKTKEGQVYTDEAEIIFYEWFLLCK